MKKKCFLGRGRGLVVMFFLIALACSGCMGHEAPGSIQEGIDWILQLQDEDKSRRAVEWLGRQGEAAVGPLVQSICDKFEADGDMSAILFVDERAGKALAAIGEPARKGLEEKKQQLEREKHRMRMAIRRIAMVASDYDYHRLVAPLHQRISLLNRMISCLDRAIAMI